MQLEFFQSAEKHTLNLQMTIKLEVYFLSAKFLYVTQTVGKSFKQLEIFKYALSFIDY